MRLEEKLRDPQAAFWQCLSSPEPYRDDEEKETCRTMIEALADDLVVHAANTSYAYWYLSNLPETSLSEENKISMAMREARRHLVYMDGDYEKAFTNLTEALEYRKEKKLDLLRTCFGSQFEIAIDDVERANEMAELIRADMMRQYNVMRGHDKHNRTVMIKFPRVKAGATEDSYILTQLYMAERSTAATEFCSLGTQERSVAIYDYNGFDSNNAPPFQMQLNAATLLQKTFPERLGLVVMVEPPFWLRGLFGMISPFLSSSITDKIKWASGVEEKEAIFGPLLDDACATPLLLRKGQLDSPVSLAHFLEDVPFYCLYDDIKCERQFGDEEQQMHQVSVTAPEQASTISSVWSTISSVSIF